MEQISTEKILLKLAKDNISKSLSDKNALKDEDIVKQYLQDILNNVKVSDEEAKVFHDKNKDLFRGASFEQVRDYLKKFMVQQKRQDELTQFIKNTGKTVPILVDASWIKSQIILVQDNPVDKARLSGKPSLVNFGSRGCGSCDMMTPILEDLKNKYERELNVLFISVQEEQILASRYGIQSIPVQIFFNKEGKEVFRHTGFIPQNEIEKKFLEMGVK